MTATVTPLTNAHNIATTPVGDAKASTRCSCGWTCEGTIWGSREALRLSHAHLAYPDRSLLELLVGPPHNGGGR